MPRFFIGEADILKDENRINVTGEDVNHIKNVLRLRTGDSITLCDGNGIDYSVEIENYEKDRISTIIRDSKISKTEPPIEITLFQGLPKSDKMDFIIQKCVELGVKRIVPVINERTVVRFDNKKDMEKKAARWNRISLEAAKQCNRAVIPSVSIPVNFNEALELSRNTQLAVIPYENETEEKLKAHMRRGISSASVFIGPEGGFTENEIKSAKMSGTKPVTLGPRILRTETAGIVVLSILMYEMGDVGV